MLRRRDVGRVLPVALSLVLLGGAWAEWRLYHGPVGDPALYHARVRAAAAELPYRVGDWVGRDVDVPPSAERLLKPNVLMARRFRHTTTGEEATLIVVQCESARDMGGHYPPVCYPHHGWVLREASSREIRLTDLRIPTMLYRFTFESADRFEEKVLYNFFVRPDGSLESGHDGVRQAAADPRAKVFGAAQVQVEVPAAMDEDRRESVVRALVQAARPVLDAVREGAPR